MEFGELVKAYRQKHNLTQQDLAEKLHITRQAVSRYETGQNMPDLDVLKAFSLLSGLSLNELVGLNGEEEETEESFVPIGFASKKQRTHVLLSCVLLIGLCVVSISLCLSEMISLGDMFIVTITSVLVLPLTLAENAEVFSKKKVYLELSASHLRLEDGSLISLDDLISIRSLNAHNRFQIFPYGKLSITRLYRGKELTSQTSTIENAQEAATRILTAKEIRKLKHPEN